MRTTAEDVAAIVAEYPERWWTAEALRKVLQHRGTPRKRITVAQALRALEGAGVVARLPKRPGDRTLRYEKTA